jgi:hypothetical protein
MATKQKRDVIADGLEGGRFYLPPSPRITLHSEQHPKLSDMLVGDMADFEITARVTNIDEDGSYGLELVAIKIHDKKGLREQAQSEMINLGELSAESLDGIFTRGDNE